MSCSCLLFTTKRHTEQEELIKDLETRNLSSNQRYTKAFLAIPLLSIIPYLLTILRPQTSLLSILSIPSLLSSAYILYYFPHDLTGIPFLDNLHKKGVSNTRKLPGLGDVVDRGPLERYLAMMNAALCGLLTLGSLLLKRDSGFQGFGLLPGAVFITILVAKYMMAQVDVDDLQRLKYGFKGA